MSVEQLAPIEPIEQPQEPRPEVLLLPEVLPEPEPAVHEPLMPTGEALRTLERDVLHSPLPPEVATEVETLRNRKYETSQQQQATVAAISDELTNGQLSRWISGGILTTPPLVEAHTPELTQVLTEVVERYTQTEAGQKDLLIKELRDVLRVPPTDEQRERLASLLKLNYSPVKARFFPGYKDKFKQALQASVLRKLRQLAPAYSLGEAEATWQDAVESEANLADTQINLAYKDGTAPLKEAWEAFHGKYKYAYESSALKDQFKSRGLARLKADVTILEDAEKKSVSELPSQLVAKQEVLSAITRGSLTIDAAIGKLRELEAKYADRIGLQELFDSIIINERRRCTVHLPEPSLVGLSYTEKDVAAVFKCLDDLDQLATVCGIKKLPGSLEAAKHGVLKEIAKTQRQFFERIDSENSLYWHFSPYGLRILDAKALQSGSLTSNILTGPQSRGVHFVKPALLGHETGIDFSSYAGTEHHLGDAYHRITDGFGVALIYGLGDLIKTSPFRDEPITKHVGIADDVVFRENETSDTQSFPLDDAYVMPMQTMQQINMLRTNPDFTDLFSGEWQPREELQTKLTRRALERAGYTSDWIGAHLLVPPKSGLHEATEVEIFAQGNRAIRAKLPPSSKVIVALRASPGSYEHHSIKGSTEAWKEELIEL